MKTFQTKTSQQLLSEGVIEKRVAELAATLSREYVKTGVTEVVALVVLKGAFVFAADFIRQMTISCRVEFVKVSSYEDATSPQHTPSIQYLFDTSTLPGKHVLIIEDIIDSGNTLHVLMADLFNLSLASLKVCALLDKEVFREGILEGYRWFANNCYYMGFRIPDKFVVGYGLDHAGLYRDLPDIRVLEEEKNGDQV